MHEGASSYYYYPSNLGNRISFIWISQSLSLKDLLSDFIVKEIISPLGGVLWVLESDALSMYSLSLVQWNLFNKSITWRLCITFSCSLIPFCVNIFCHFFMLHLLLSALIVYTNGFRALVSSLPYNMSTPIM